jgi:hypothetical protein
MEHDVAHGQPKWNPGLIERDDGNHDEEVKVRLNGASGQVDHNTRNHHQAETRNGAAPRACQMGDTRCAGHDGGGQGLGEGM